MRKRKKKLPMPEYGKRPDNNIGHMEYIVQNSGRRKVEKVEVGGHEVELGSSGATVYDPGLAKELKAKYQGDPCVFIIEKPFVRKPDGHRRVFANPALPWKDD